MADLSKLSDQDLQALSQGRLKDVSDEALTHLSGGPAPSVPRLPLTYSPGGTPAQASLDNPEATQKFAALGTGLATGGMGAAATEGLAGLGGVAARVGASAASGAAQGAMEPATSGQDRMANTGIGAVGGGALGAAGEGLSAIIGKAGSSAQKMARMTNGQADAYLSNPSETSKLATELQDPNSTYVRDQAVNAIQNSRKAIRSQGLGNASDLHSVLAGKQVTVDPKSLMGYDDTVDQLVKAKVPSYQDMPQQMTFEGNELNDIKRQLQRAADFKAGTQNDPVQLARNAQAAQAASGVRGALESAGGADVKSLNSQMQQGSLLNEFLRKGLKTPIATASTANADKMASLASAEGVGGQGLTDLGQRIGAAKTMANPDTGSGIPSFGVKALGRLGMRGAQTAEDAQVGQSPLVQALLLNGIGTSNGK